jgi:hypothetical protein
MNNIDEKLNKVLDIEILPQSDNNEISIIETLPDIDEGRDIQIKNDYNHARNTLHNLIRNGEDSISSIISLAKESEHPRAFEVVSQLLKTTGDLTKELVVLQKNMDKLDIKDSTRKNVVNNNVFVGNTKDFLKMMKDHDRDI